MHITPHANGEPILKRSSSHSHSSPVLQRFCLLSGLPTVTVVLLLPSTSSKVNLLNDDTYQWDSATVTVSFFRKNRARCAVNKEILDLLNKESISGVRIGRAGL